MGQQKSQRIFSERYKKAYQLCHKLLVKKLKGQGKTTYLRDENLIQSVLASLEVTDLIMQNDFDPTIYTPVITKTIDNTRKELFPDLAKKRFIPISKLENQLHEPESKVKVKILDYSEHENHLILKGLPEKSKAYIKKLLASVKTKNNLLYTNSRHILKKVSLISQLFPDRKVPFVQEFWDNMELTDKQIIDIYKCVLGGIEKNFPVNFLKTQSEFKSSVLVRFLFSEILPIKDPHKLLEINREVFADYRLTGVLRYFNYSVKKVIHNAYPDAFSPWQGGKTNTNFWDYQQNRINAVRWLVELKLAINVKKSIKIQINKKDFSAHGLSYLFNTYYNSTSRALNEAYPDLKPWQTAALPRSYWNKEKTEEALCWMIDKLGWTVDALQAKYNNQQLTRNTFAQFGLSGLFENKFNCNIYNLVDFIWPGKFKNWEFGNMSAHFWNSAENRKRFSDWFSKKFNINMLNDKSTFKSLEEVQEYRFYSSLYKYCRGDFRHLLRVYARDIAEQNKSRILLRKWDVLIKKEKETMLERIILHGFFFNLVKSQKINAIDTFERMKNRSQRSCYLIS